MTNRLIQGANCWYAYTYKTISLNAVNKINFNSLHSILVRYFATDVRDNSSNPYIPIESLVFSFVRSSGPGGQNVNKVNTKAELRLNLNECDWIERDTKQRLYEHETFKKRINSNNELVLTSQEHRTQANNKKECIKKLKNMLIEASIVPKERIISEELSEREKNVRIKDRKHRSSIKKNRSRGFDD